MSPSHYAILAILSLYAGIAVSAPPPECRLDRVDTVMVDDGVKSTIIGAIEYSMGTDGEYTGATGSPKPAGPSIVFIIRHPSPDALAAIRKVHPGAHDGAVYLWPKGSPWQTMRYLCDIDPSLEPDQLAALFGVKGGQQP